VFAEKFPGIVNHTKTILKPPVNWCYLIIKRQSIMTVEEQPIVEGVEKLPLLHALARLKPLDWLVHLEIPGALVRENGILVWQHEDGSKVPCDENMTRELPKDNWFFIPFEGY
jgi:hypothetical protein